MLWIKALHIVFMVTWFAGLFYLPRLYIYDREAEEAVVKARLGVMESRLLVITHIGAALTLISGITLLSLIPGYLQQGWLHAKLALVASLLLYHVYLIKLRNQLRENRCLRSSRWLRVFNEIPALLLIGIVLLVVVKPF